MANRKTREKRNEKIYSYFALAKEKGDGICEIVKDLSDAHKISETHVRNILKEKGLI